MLFSAKIIHLAYALFVYTDIVFHNSYLHPTRFLICNEEAVPPAGVALDYLYNTSAGL